MAYINLPNDPVTGNLRDGEDYSKGSYVYANDKAIVDEVNGNLDNVNIKSSANIAVSKISGTAVNLVSEQVVENKNFVNCTIGASKFDLEKALVPIGTIVPIYDFSGALTFDSDYYAYCNGQSKTIGGVSRTLPDLSNRYIVGFGAEGGADIGSAAWDTTEVGNASHQVNIQHTHTIDHGHSDTLTYSLPRHYHGVSGVTVGTQSASHNHSVSGGSHDHTVAASQNDGTSAYAARRCGTVNTTIDSGSTSHTHTVGNQSASHTHALSGSVGYTSGESADAAAYDDARSCGGSVTAHSGNSGNGGSTTQTIQPRSIRCRYIMRIK